MQLTALIVAILGIIATGFVGWWVSNRTNRLLKRIDSILIARTKKEEYSEILRLIGDIEKSGTKRGTVVLRSDGSWGIDWFIEIGGGQVKAN
jgi:hypothetical protein